jgi:phosphatidate cytidylyltransferase
MLAAWEWGQLSGFTSRTQRVWLAVLCGLVLALMLFTLPEYHHDIHQPLVAGSLWISLAWWVAALLLVLFYPGSAALWRNSKVLRLIFGLLTIIPFFWGMVALRAWHYDENHYSGAIWLLYVMILVWGLTPGPICLVNCLANISWHRRFLRAKPGKDSSAACLRQRSSPGATASGRILKWHRQYTAVLIFAALASVLGDLTESMFKREAGIKDSGHLIPGHGGILDRIDSLTAAVPVFACLLLLVFGTI